MPYDPVRDCQVSPSPGPDIRRDAPSSSSRRSSDQHAYSMEAPSPNGSHSTSSHHVEYGYSPHRGDVRRSSEVEDVRPTSKRSSIHDLLQAPAPVSIHGSSPSPSSNGSHDRFVHMGERDEPYGREAYRAGHDVSPTKRDTSSFKSPVSIHRLLSHDSSTDSEDTFRRPSQIAQRPMLPPQEIPTHSRPSSSASRSPRSRPGSFSTPAPQPEVAEPHSSTFAFQRTPISPASTTIRIPEHHAPQQAVRPSSASRPPSSSHSRKSVTPAVIGVSPKKTSSRASVPPPPPTKPYDPVRVSRPDSVHLVITPAELEEFVSRGMANNPLRHQKQNGSGTGSTPAASRPGSVSQQSSEVPARRSRQFSTASDMGPDPKRRHVAAEFTYKGNAGHVAQHYNARPEIGVASREQSPIIGLKKFNNWVKSVLIGKFAYRERSHPKSRGANVLDIGCGKGGDLNKWKQARIQLYVGLGECCAA